MLTQDLPAFRKSKSQTASRLPTGKERIERMGSFEFRKARPVIHDLKLNKAVGRFSCRERNCSTARLQRLPTVTKQFAEHDGQLNWVRI